MKYKLNHLRKTKKGFTLIELLIIFAISAVIFGVGVNSFGSYNGTQSFNNSVSDVSNMLSVARSRAIAQVKPLSCGITPLDGYEVKITQPSDYVQNAVCGSTSILMQQKKLPSQVSFVSGSASRILFNVGTGTVSNRAQIGLSGFGKTSTISVNKTGIISHSTGLSITPVPTTVTPTSTITTAPGNIIGKTWYTDGSGAKSGPPGTVITAYATNAVPNTNYNLVIGTDGGNQAAPCSQNVSLLNTNNRTSSGAGIIGSTGGSINVASGTWQICFKEVGAGQRVTSPVTFTVTAASPTATPTPNVTVAISSSPNPSTYGQNVTFSGNVTGNNCVPVGNIYFYIDNVLFTAAPLSSGTNPKTGSVQYTHSPSTKLTVGSHTLKGMFNGSGCPPGAESPTINHNVLP